MWLRGHATNVKGKFIINISFIDIGKELKYNFNIYNFNGWIKIPFLSITSFSHNILLISTTLLASPGKRIMFLAHWYSNWKTDPNLVVPSSVSDSNWFIGNNVGK